MDPIVKLCTALDLEITAAEELGDKYIAVRTVAMRQLLQVVVSLVNLAPAIRASTSPSPAFDVRGMAERHNVPEKKEKDHG